MRRAVSGDPNTLIIAHGGLWIAAHSYVSIELSLVRLPNAQPIQVTPSGDRWQQRVIGEQGRLTR